MRQNAVLLGCSTRGGLAVARSLARAGIRVTTVAPTPNNVVHRSRYPAERIIAPAPEDDAQGFIEMVLGVVNRLHECVVIAMTDQTTLVLDENRHRMPPGAKLALSGSGAIRSVLDKSANLEIAAELAIPFPRTDPWEEPVDPDHLIARFGLPLVIKNPFPESAAKEHALPFRFEIIHTREDLEECLKSIVDRKPEPMFQEYVSGIATNVCCFAIEGEVIAAHQYLSRRRTDHAGIMREIVPLRSDLRDYAERMLGRLKWTGAAHLGFIVSLDGSRVWYMETNGRFWASVQGSVHAGWNMPLWMYQYCATGSRPTPGPIREGSKTCYRSGDLRLIIGYLSGGRSPTFYTDPGKLSAISQYLLSFGPSVHSDVWDWRDPKPGLIDIWRTVKDLAGRAKRRLLRRR